MTVEAIEHVFAGLGVAFILQNLSDAFGWWRGIWWGGASSNRPGWWTWRERREQEWKPLSRSAIRAGTTGDKG